MLNVTTATKNAYLNDAKHKTLSILIDGVDRILSNGDVDSESLEYEERVVSGKDLQIVGCMASVFKITFRTLTEDVTGQDITVNITSDNTETITLFQGKIDKCEQVPHSKEKNIVAYDKLYELSQTNVASWYNTLNFPMSFKQFRDRLFSHLNITQVDADLPFDEYLSELKKDYEPNELNALDLIKSICQISCVFGRMTRDNKFEYVTPPTSLTVQQKIDYYKEADYQEYMVRPINSLIIRVDDNDYEYSDSSADNKYIIQDNFFTVNLDANTLRVMAETLFDVISNFQYQPLNTDVNGLPYVQCLDVISIPVKNLSNDTPVDTPFIVLERTITGIQALRDNFVAEGDETQNEFITDISIQLDRLKKQVKVIRDNMDNLEFAYYLLTNTEEIDIEDGEDEYIIDMWFAAKKESVVTFNCEILCDVETTEYNDAVATLTYYLNGLEIEGFHPTETWVDGKHILNLYYYFKIQDSGIKYFKVKMQMSGGSVSIATSNLMGAVYGQNLQASSDWDGNITVEDEVSDFTLTDISFENVTDNVQHSEVTV